jgi:hypothetical protein
VSFHIHVDITEAAAKLNQTNEFIATQMQTAVGTIAAATHAFILQTVNAELTGYKREAYLGKENKNVRWIDLGNSMWVVEVDETARWLEEGRAEPMFMEWLLKNAKTARDGSKYKIIPFKQDQGAGKTPGFHPNKPALAAVTKRMLDAQNIDLNKIERDVGGKPKVGILHKIPMGREEIMAEMQPKRRDYFSMPRSADIAGKIGLKPHDGIFMLKGLMVVQRPNASAKHGVTREAITYRVISSKHKAEGRWFYPKVEALNAVPRAAEWAQQQLDSWMKEFEKGFIDIQGQ